MSLDVSDLPLLRRELQLERRRVELLAENALDFYEPHPKQELFHSNAEYRFRYARTGNRFGKSEMGAAEDVAYALGFRPWYSKTDPRRTVGIPSFPTVGLIVTTDWDKSREIFTEDEKAKLVKYIPKTAWGQIRRNHSGAIDYIQVRHVTGKWSTIRVETEQSFKQNPKGCESSAWDWVHIDEPIPEAMWKAIVRGFVDRGGRAWFTCTPITEPWIDAEFVPDLESQSRADLGVIASSADSRWMMTGEMDDNPHLTKENIELTLSWYTPEEREARRKGVPLAYSGIIYKEFQWALHVRKDVPPGWTDWQHPPKDWTLRYAIDYHPRKPNAVLFIATSPQEIHYVFAELWTPSLVSDFVAEIKALCPEPTVPALIDPLASTPNKVTDLTFLDELTMHGLPLIPATKDPHNGIIKVKELLHARQKSGLPVIFFNAACTHTLFEISRGYQWDKETNKPLKQDDDMMENFYRLVLQGLTYVEPAGVNDYVPIPAGDLPENVIDIREFDWNDTPKKVSNSHRYRR